jgi:hypothetical protein
MGIFCPQCGDHEFYFMSSGRLRCSNCKIDYNPFFDTAIVPGPGLIRQKFGAIPVAVQRGPYGHAIRNDGSCR